MILADDNFATIIKAVANGRNVYRNILNAIQFLMSGNMAGILCVLYTTLRNLPTPFAPVHLLFMNLVTDSLPALAIGMEPPEEGLLKRPPRETGDFDRSLPKRDHDPGISHCGLYHDGIFSWIIWMAGMYGGKCDWFQCCSGDYGIFYLNIGPLIPWIYLPQSPESFQNRHFQ